MIQAEIGNVLGWSREKVKNYAALRKIEPKAWEIIGTAFEENFVVREIEAVPQNGTTVPPFAEGLLRQILSLDPIQQLELVTDLASSAINKAQFSKRATIAYKPPYVANRYQHLLGDCSNLAQRLARRKDWQG